MNRASNQSAEGRSIPAIELRGITKHFGKVRANQNVSLSVQPGEIHGVIGENGAGKSTLMSILYGFYEADQGEILVRGLPVEIKSSKQAISAGIGMVHQHFMLVEPFTVLENILLGAEPNWRLKPSLDSARQHLNDLATRYGMDVDLDALVSDLPVGIQQRVEILKALYKGAEILILDEPTGVLTPQEVDQLFDILRALKSKGVSVLLITHKLQEVIAITDSVSVMRSGEIVAKRMTSETDRTELAELMVGRKVLLNVNKTAARPQAVLLKTVGLSWRDPQGVLRLDDLSLQLCAGEILGVAGVSGNGQTELLALLSGMIPVQQGSFTLLDRCIDADHPCSPREMREIGLGHIAEDRHREGMVGAFEARETAIMGFHDGKRFNSGLLLDQSAITDNCQALMASFDVRPQDPYLRSANLSGGNQQKLVIAREIAPKPRVLLVGQPTRGVDIGAIEFIHKELVALRDSGSALLVVSVELEEVLSLCDRILVMSEGRIVGETMAADTDARTLGLMMGQSRSHQAVDESNEAVL